MSFQFRNDFHVCPNPLGLDPYNMCEWDCRFCFIKQWERGWQKQKTKGGLEPYPLDDMRRRLKTAFDSNDLSKDNVIRSLRMGLPVIMGRKCEPFCPSEEEHRATKKCIRLLERYEVPFVVETRGVENVWDYLVDTDTKHGAHISIMFGDETVHDAMEPETPSYEKRWELAEKLKETGMYVGLIAEPVIATLNDSVHYYIDYADRAAEIGVDHVNFGELRIAGNVKTFADRLAEGGVDLLTAVQVKGGQWKDIGDLIFKTFNQREVPISTPDWVNFHDQNDCLSCCGLTKFHSCHGFNYQAALNRLKHKGRITWDDFANLNPFNQNAEERIRDRWNNEKTYYSLADVDGVEVVGQDEDENNIYGMKRRKTLMEVFG